jgi:Uma2 family endonuclease
MPSRDSSRHPSIPDNCEPAWDVALLHPMQGAWSHEDYLSLTDETNWLIEYTDGRIDVLAFPTTSHQLIVKTVFFALYDFVEPDRLGLALFAPIRVQVTCDKYRTPDIVFTFTRQYAEHNNRFFEGADLVIEIVSSDPESRKRDLIQKPLDYAEGGIPEYWIVDPQEKMITVLALAGKAYEQHGVFGEGQVATSKLLAGFSLPVTDVFAAAKV